MEKHCLIWYYLPMKGIYPKSYFKNPDINKPLEEIWDDIDAYSGEFFEDEVKYHDKIDFIIPLPPLKYENKITKGICFSQGLEYLLKLYPDLQKIFFCGAYTMWSSYSWCDKADFYLACYENKKREEYHKNKYQNKRNIIFTPLQDADYTNEYTMAPGFYTPKTIDVLCVSTPLPVKNLPLLIESIKKYEDKYNKILNVTLILGSPLITKNKNGKLNYSKSPKSQQEELQKTEALMKDTKSKLTILPFVEYKDLPAYYSASKCCVLASLIEGKNRSVNEAMSCNVPVILFKQHNQWARGDYPIFFGNSGELAQEFNAESLADAIHKTISNPKNYEPRKNYLTFNGRKNFINKLTKSIPYFKENIPHYKEDCFHENLWVDLAVQENYQIGYHDFLYGKNPAISHVGALKI